MATEVGRIVARYIADTTNFDRGNARVKAGMASTGAQGKKMGAGLGTYAKYGVLGVGAAVFGAVKSFANFDRNMNIFQANTEAGRKTMQAARKEAIRLGADARFPAVTAAHVADTLVELSKAGLKANQSIKALEPVMLLGTAGQMDFADAGQIAANAMNAFQLKTKDIPAVVDDIAGAALKSSSNVQDIAEAFRYSSSAAAGLGVPVKQVTTLAAMLSNLGLKGDMAGTSMRMFFTSIAKPRSNPAREAMDKLHLLTKGGKSKFFTKEGEIKSIKEISRLWHNATKHMSRQARVAAEHTIFGVRGMNTARVLDLGPKRFAAMQKASTKHGSAARLAAANTKGLYGAFQRLVNVVQTVGLQLGEQLAPTVIKVFDALAKVGGMISSHPKIIKALADAVILVTGAWVAWRAAIILQAVASGIAGAATAVYETIVLACIAPVDSLKAAQMSLNSAFFANPIGIVILAIIALILILRHFGVSMHDVIRVVKVAWSAIKDAFWGSIRWIKEKVSGMWKWMKGAFTSAKNWLADVFHKYWKDALIVALTGPFSPIIVLIHRKIHKIKHVIHTIVNYVIGLATAIYNAGKNFGSRLKDGILDGMTGIKKSIEDKLGIPKWARRSLKDDVMGLFRASGGPVSSGRPYVVGERGPEWFVPRNSGMILPHGVSPAMGGGGSSVTVEHMTVRSEDDIYSIASQLGRRLLP